MTKTNQFWRVASAALCCLLLGYFVFKTAMGLGYYQDWTLLYAWYKYLAGAVALVLCGGLCLYVVTNKGVETWHEEVIIEVKKVVWPQKQEIKGSTIAVIVITILFSIVLALFDSVWKVVLGFIYGFARNIF